MLGLGVLTGFGINHVRSATEAPQATRIVISESTPGYPGPIVLSR
jgi:hypothetical protein